MSTRVLSQETSRLRAVNANVVMQNNEPVCVCVCGLIEPSDDDSHTWKIKVGDLRYLKVNITFPFPGSNMDHLDELHHTHTHAVCLTKSQQT